MSESTARDSVPFVGRETELQQLHQALRSVISSGKPQFVLIQGDFGVGKTVLVEHFLVEVRVQNPSILIGQGKCAMETERSGLIPLGQLLRSLTERGVQQRIVLSNVLEFVKEVAPAWLDIFTVGAASAVIKSVEEGRKLLGRSSTFSQENVFMQFTNALSRLVEKQPVVAFIDDLQWADASSLRLLFHLARYLQDRAVLFVCTYRPVEAMETGPNAELFRDIRANLIRYGAAEIEIRQGINVAEYVTQRYPLNVFSSDSIAHVQELTGGHALFVSQLFSLWEETGVIASAPAPDGQPVWGLERDVGISPAIPPTLSEVLKERIRLIEDELREILTFASVEGEDFTAQVIARLRQLDEYEALENLETLERRYHLVQEQGTRRVDSTVLDFYRFVHRFFREYIYGQLSGSKRRILHRLVGECLEALYSDQHEIAGQLALHFHEAFEPMKSARYALMAAQFEQSRYAWAEGERWCEFGLALIDKMPSDAEAMQLRLDLLEQLGYGYYHSGKYSQADQVYRAALTLAQQLQVDAERIATLCINLAYICDSRSQLSEALRFLDQGRRILTDCAVPSGETQVRLEALYGGMQVRVGSNDLASQSLRRTLANTEKLPRTPTLEYVRAEAYNWLATALSTLDQYSEASAAYQKASEIAEGIGEKKLASSCLLNLADSYVYDLKLDESEASLSKALELVRQVGDLDNEAYARATKARILLARGKPQEAIDELRHAITLSEQIGAMWNMPSMYADLAIAYLALSDLETAYQHATRSVACAGTDHFELGHALDALAQVEAAQQSWKAAAEHFTQAIVFFQKIRDRHFVARAQRHFAEALLQQGEQQEAVELLETALATFQKLGLPHEIAETQHLLDTIL
jgi:tetratricopeptide (TPR) repeat protein